VSNHAAEQPGFEQKPLRGDKSPKGGRPKYPELQPLSDESVMQEVQMQNGDALAILFDRYYNVVISIALKILHDRAEAEDVLQVIFLEVYQKATQYDPARGRFYSWLMQLTYSRTISRRNYLIVRQFYAHFPVEDLSDFDHGANNLYSQPPQECRRFVHQALALLTDAQKRAIEMYHFEGLTFWEIAERTNQSYPSVRNHYYRGVGRLRHYLKSVHQDAGEKASKISDLEVKRAEA
jgi:RNA polymerase sigma-70 factor, ECF subfamily